MLRMDFNQSERLVYLKDILQLVVPIPLLNIQFIYLSNVFFFLNNLKYTKHSKIDNNSLIVKIINFFINHYVNVGKYLGNLTLYRHLKTSFAREILNTKFNSKMKNREIIYISFI